VSTKYKMRFLFLLALLVFCRKSRSQEKKVLQRLHDLLVDLEAGINEFEEQVGNLESFDSDDFVEEALGESYDSEDESDSADLYSESDEFDLSYSESDSEEEVAIGDVLKENVEHWLYRYLASEMGVYDNSEDKESAVGSDSYSSSDSAEYESDDFDLNEYDAFDDDDDDDDDDSEEAVGYYRPFGTMYDSADSEYLESVVGNLDSDWSSDVDDFNDIYNPDDSAELHSGEEIAVGNPDVEYFNEIYDFDETPALEDEIAIGDPEVEDFDDIYESEDSPNLYSQDEVAIGDSGVEDFDDIYDSEDSPNLYSDEVAVGGSDEFYEDIPTPGEEYPVGEEAADDETTDNDEVPVDTLFDFYTDDEEEPVGDIYDLGDYTELFEDPEEIPVATHGFDFLQEQDPYFEE